MQVCARAFLASGITPRCPPQVGSLPACVPQGQLSPLCSTAAAPASPQPCSCRGLAVHPPFPGVQPDAGTAVGAGGRCGPLVLQGREGSAPCWHPGTLLEPPGWGLPGARIALTAALGVPAQTPSALGCWSPGQPPHAEGGARWPSCCASWGGTRSPRVPWFLPQPWLSQAERCPGRWLCYSSFPLPRLCLPPLPSPKTRQGIMPPEYMMK